MKLNNKGFTLIELIMVVAILALLAMLFTPNVMKLINRNNIETYNATIESIENAAKVYVSNNRYNLGINCSVTGGNIKNIKLSELLDSGDLSKTPDNPCKKESDFTVDDTVKVTYDCSTKQFSYEFRDKLELTDVCN